MSHMHLGTSPLDRRIKDMVVADTFHVVGLYPHDPVLLSKFEAANTDGSSRSSSPRVTTNNSFNPFAFNSFSRVLAGQDAWRREPSPGNIDLAACLGVSPAETRNHVAGERESGPNLAIAALLLLIEDEFERSPFVCTS
jgi:hypothetical protein